MIVFKKIKDPDNKHDTLDIEMRSESITWPDLIEEFKQFLRACGYVIPLDDEE